MRKVPIVTGQIYHIFNRGVNKGTIFFSEVDYRRFYNAAIHYKTSNVKFSYEKSFYSKSHNDPVSLKVESKLEVLAYCLMPNHFHFLVKQLVDGGVTSYFRRLLNGYSHFVNVKYHRVGPLFQGRFKSVHIESDNQLLHISRYIHLNPIVSGLVSKLENYSWSSYLSYVAELEDNLCETEFLEKYFKSKEDYQKFVIDQIDYGKKLELIKHLTIDYQS